MDSKDMPIQDDTKVSLIDLDTQCTIVMDRRVKTADDFVAVISDPDGTIGIYFNTDAVTLGIGIKMLSQQYLKMMSEMPKESRDAVVDILGEEFSIEALLG